MYTFDKKKMNTFQVIKEKRNRAKGV